MKKEGLTYKDPPFNKILDRANLLKKWSYSRFAEITGRALTL
jgi:hypothetical protein